VNFFNYSFKLCNNLLRHLQFIFLTFYNEVFKKIIYTFKKKVQTEDKLLNIIEK